MRKIIAVLLAGLLILSACVNSNKAPEQTNSSSTTSETAAQQTETASITQDSEVEKKPIDVDKGLLSTSVTLPASMFEGVDMNEAIAEAKADGVDDVTVNKDGSITYKVSRAKYNEMLAEAKKSLEEYIDQLKSGEDFTSIKDVKYDKKFTTFTLVVDRSAYENSFDGFAALGLYMTAMFYQIVDGVDADKVKTTIHTEDIATDEVFNTVVYPDTLNN